MRISDWSADVCSSDLGEGIATQLDPQINMWDVSAPFVRAWVRDELGPEAALADRIREDAKTLLRLPGLLRRLEAKFPPKGGAPEPPPLPDLELPWESRARPGPDLAGHLLAPATGAATVVVEPKPRQY